MEAIKKEICEQVDRVKDDLFQLSKKIFEHPELSSQEFQAVRWLTGELEKHGFNIVCPYGGLETSFRASIKGQKEGPRIAFLAEYDALRGLGHACGHNIIAASAVGAGIALSKFMKDLDGEINVIGTPAEEAGGGKIILLENGAFSDIEYCLMVHPGAKSMIGRGGLACTALEVEFHGKQAHSSGPDKGINALQSLIAVFNGIDSLRSTLRDQTRINGIITHGGTASNVIPDYAKGEFTIRAKTMKYLEYVVEKVRVIIRNAELLTGAKAIIAIEPMYAERYPNMIMEEAFKANMEFLGEQMVYPESNERMGSSDIGNVSMKIPISHPYLKIVDSHILTHTKEFAAAANSERANEVIIKAAKGLAMTGYDILANETLRRQINEEFKAKIMD